MTKCSVLAAAVLFATGSTAGAEGWSVVDMTTMETRAECMARAEATIARYRQTYDASGIDDSTEWTVAGYNLRGDVIDALFICPTEAGLISPFLIVYNVDNDSAARQLITDRLREIWGQNPHRNDGAAPADGSGNGQAGGGSDGNEGIVDFDP